MDRKFLRPGWIVGHLLVVVAVLVCLRLSRWQWHRMQDGGTVQNFGYAVLWPVFGAAFIYMWVRFLQLEKLKDLEDDAELTALAAGDPAAVVGDGPGAAGLDPVSAPTVRTSTSTSTTTASEPPAAEPDLPSPPVRPVPGAGQPTQHPPTDKADDGDPRPARLSRNTQSTGVTVSVATVGGDDEDDLELAAYNRALAALAEKDHRRAR